MCGHDLVLVVCVTSPFLFSISGFDGKEKEKFDGLTSIRQAGRHARQTSTEIPIISCIRHSIGIIYSTRAYFGIWYNISRYDMA